MKLIKDPPYISNNPSFLCGVRRRFNVNNSDKEPDPEKLINESPQMKKCGFLRLWYNFLL